jgi:hypothetical protein
MNDYNCSLKFYAIIENNLDLMNALFSTSDLFFKNYTIYDYIYDQNYFEIPIDYCSVSQFYREDHPDFAKYIKKDNIPCWGCNVNM